MKVLKSFILVVAVVTASSAFLGCSQHSDTLTSIAVIPASQTMMKGTTQQFKAMGLFTNGMDVTWTPIASWSSSDTLVATVTNTAGSYANGLVTSVANGTAIITAYDVANNITGTALITVTDPESIRILPTNPYMAVGTKHQLGALALFSKGTATQGITNYVTWSSFSPGVATITDTRGVIGNGIVVAGAGPGTAEIKADDPISGATGTTTLTIKSTPLATIAVTPINPIILLSTRSTTTLQFAGIGTFQDGSTTEALPPSWAWSSSNTSVATIDNYTGLAQSIAPGTTTIRATDLITGVSGNTTLTLQ